MTVPNITHARERSVQSQPTYDQSPRSALLYMSLASAADTFTPWGNFPAQRDRELRAFWPTEPLLAGAVATVCARNASSTVVFDGPPATLAAVQEMWKEADFGKGPHHFLMKVSEDLYTQDNAAFVEIVRGGPRPDSAVVGIAHLDSRQCRRTGNPEFPVVYVDPRNGSQHRMGWWQVITLEEMPSPIVTMNGMQYCALTRILRAAQLMRDITVYEMEKVGGRNPSSLHLVGGVQQTVIDDAIKRGTERADNEGLVRFVLPTILASLDPTAEVSHVEIPLKGLPDGYDKAEQFKQYIAVMALGFLEDYQTFAPLPGGNLGTSAQSDILHLKARGKGPGLFTKLLIHALMNQGILPRSVEARVEDKDVRADLEEAQVKDVRATTRAARITSGEITPPIARQLANDEGDLDDEYLQMLNEQDMTPTATVTDEQRPDALSLGAADAVQAAAPQALLSGPTPPLQLYTGKARGELLGETLAAMRAAVKALHGGAEGRA